MQSSKTTRALPLIDAVLAIGVAAALLFSSPVRGEERQKLYVLFVTNAPHLKGIYGSTGYSRIGRGLSDQLAKLGNEHYGFLEWRSINKEVAPGAPVPVLTIYLRSQDVKLGKKSAPFEVFLESSGYLAGSTEKKEPVPKRPLYRPMQTLPKDVKSLNAEIEKNIADFFEKQDLKRSFNEFLGHIPISHHAGVLGNLQRLMVPLCRSQIAAGKDSKMEIDVLSRKSSGDEVPAHLELGVLEDLVKPKDFPAAYRMIQCDVKIFNFGDDIQNYPTWHPRIPEVFDQRVSDNGTLNVYMTTYVKSYIGVDGSKVVTPRQGEDRWERVDPCQP